MTDWIESAAKEIERERDRFVPDDGHLTEYGVGMRHGFTNAADTIRRNAPSRPAKVLAIFWKESSGVLTRLAAVEYKGEFVQTLLNRYAAEFAFDVTRLTGVILDVVLLGN